MKTNQEMLGEIGERIRANWCSQNRSVIELSLDPFDSVKDLKVDGKIEEVKTQTRYVVNDCCSINPNQLKKCSNGFIWIECPTDKSPYCGMWKIKKGFKYGQSTRKNGDVRYDVYANQEAMVLVTEFLPDSPQYKALKRYSTNY